MAKFALRSHQTPSALQVFSGAACRIAAKSTNLSQEGAPGFSVRSSPVFSSSSRYSLLARRIRAQAAKPADDDEVFG